MKSFENGVSSVGVVYGVMSGRVSCSLVVFSSHDAPYVAHTAQRSVCSSQKPTYTELAYAVGSALASVTHDVAMRGHRFVARHRQTAEVVGVGVLTEAPWSVDRYVAHRHLADVPETMNARAFEQLRTSYLPESETGLHAEHEIVSCHVDDISYAHAHEHVGREFSASIYTSMVIQPMARIIEDCVGRYWNADMFFDVHTVPWMMYQHVQTQEKRDEYMLVNVSDEATSITEVRKNGRMETHVVPHGYYDMVRHMSAVGTIAPETVLSQLLLCERGVCDAQTALALKASFEEAYRAWECEVAEYVPGVVHARAYAGRSPVWHHADAWALQDRFITPHVCTSPDGASRRAEPWLAVYREFLNRTYFNHE